MKGITEQINEELTAKVGYLVQMVEQKEELEGHIFVLQSEIKKLKTAFDALNGAVIQPDTEVIVAPEVPKAVQPVPVPPAPVKPQGLPLGTIRCNSCDGLMTQQQRTLQSGRTVTLWVCGECSNEKL